MTTTSVTAAPILKEVAPARVGRLPVTTPMVLPHSQNVGGLQKTFGKMAK